MFVERPDINFNFPNCEACFIEVLCDNPCDNHVFGVLYRHPHQNVRDFTCYLGEFLEILSSNKVNATILGDTNVDLNKSNLIATEYLNTIHSSGFSELINKPTRIFCYENSNTVSCSTIDHILTNNSQNFSCSGILVTEISDHLPVFGIMSLKKPSIVEQIKNQKRRFFHPSKKQSFLDCLEEKLHIQNLSKLDPNSQMAKLCLQLKRLLIVFSPYKTHQTNKRSKF